MKLDKTLRERLDAIRIGDQVSYQTDSGVAHGLCVGWSDVFQGRWLDLAREKYVIVDSETRIPLEAVCSRRRESGVNRGIVTWD